MKMRFNRYHPRLDRFMRGLRYALGRATQDDAKWMLYECEGIAGIYSLAGFSTVDVIENASEEYEDTPEFREVCEHAAARVAHKWSDTGDTASAALDWAMDLVREWAPQHDLKRLPEDVAA